LFPPNSVGTALTFGGASAFPAGGFSTDSNGEFSVLVEVPPASGGGALTPGTKIISVTIGQITGTTTAFSIPQPKIVLSNSEASVEDTVTVEGTGFDSLVNATILTIGTNTSVMPSPAPRSARNGDITATFLVPLFNPGTYVIVFETGANFSATTTITIVSSGAPGPSTADDTQDVFADVISNEDNLVRVWRFTNSDGSWAFYDPRTAFELANTLLKTGAGDIVWVNVVSEQEFQDRTLFSGWNLILLK
jgi:hypothetical protein